MALFNKEILSLIIILEKYGINIVSEMLWLWNLKFELSIFAFLPSATTVAMTRSFKFLEFPFENFLDGQNLKL